MGQARLRGTQEQREAQAKAALVGLTPDQQRRARGRQMPAAKRKALLLSAVVEGAVMVLSGALSNKRAPGEPSQS